MNGLEISKKGETFKTTLTAKLRHGVLWDIRKQFKSNREMAEYLGISQWHLSNLLNLQFFIDPDSPYYKTSEKWQKIFRKLMELSGKGIYDIFPPELAGKKFRTNFEVSKEVPISSLLEAGEEMVMLPVQEEQVSDKELHNNLDQIMSYRLTEQEHKWIKLIYEEGYTNTEIAEMENLSHTRISQAVLHGLAKMRRHFAYKGIFKLDMDKINDMGFPSSPQPKGKKCPECGETFYPNHMNQKFSSDKCRIANTEKINKEAKKKNKMRNYAGYKP